MATASAGEGSTHKFRNKKLGRIKHKFTTCCFFGSVAYCLPGCLAFFFAASWLPGFLASPLPGFGPSWLRGFFASWLLGFPPSWLLGLSASWLPALLASWLVGFVALYLPLKPLCHMIIINSILSSSIMVSITFNTRTAKKSKQLRKQTNN